MAFQSKTSPGDELSVHQADPSQAVGGQFAAAAARPATVPQGTSNPTTPGAVQDDLSNDLSRAMELVDAKRHPTLSRDIAGSDLQEVLGIATDRAERLIAALIRDGVLAQGRHGHHTILAGSRGAASNPVAAELVSGAAGTDAEDPGAASGAAAPSHEVPPTAREAAIGDRPNPPTDESDGQADASYTPPWTNQTPTRRSVALDGIRVDPDLQPRESLREEAVRDYAAAMAAGKAFPPVVAFGDGQTLWLADGFHRVAAAARAGLEAIEAEVHRGSRDDALLYAAGANATNGERRTNADRRRAVRMVLTHPAWEGRSSRWIAEVVGVDKNTVDRVRRELERCGELHHTSVHRMSDGRLCPARRPKPAAKARAGGDEPTSSAPLSLATETAHEVSPTPRPARGKARARKATQAGSDADAWLAELEGLVARGEADALSPEGRAALTSDQKAQVAARLKQVIGRLQALRRTLPTGPGLSAAA